MRNNAVALHTKPQSPLAPAAVRVFQANERMNQMLLRHIDSNLWNAKPPGKVRSIAAIFTHIHNIRTKWIRLSAPHLDVPAQLHRTHCTLRQARTALAESGDLCAAVLTEALGNGRVAKFHRDNWGAPWPAGIEMLCYMLAHEAHHRGQVCMLAHQLGSPLPQRLTSDLWNWEKLWRQGGASPGPGRD